MPRVRTMATPNVIPDHVDAPHWDLVPFPVHCGRCGQDLWGQSDPQCPACSLQFTWSNVVPIDSLTCGTCAYPLKGLTTMRCPECGATFTWDEALAAHRRRLFPLVEHRWREAPVRSFVFSMWQGFWSRRLWQQLDLQDHPSPRLLLGIAAVAFLVYVITLPVAMLMNGIVEVTVDWFRWGAGDPFPTLDEMLRYFRARFPHNMVVGCVCGLGWCAGGLGALMILRQSMRRFKILPVHVVRVWVYSMPLMLPVFVVLSWILFWLVYAVVHLAMDDWFNKPHQVIDCLDFGALVIIVAILNRNLRNAYRFYLRMDHALGVAVSAHLVAILFMTTLGLVPVWFRD